MAYTTIDDPSAYFQTATYTGNGNATNAITNDGNSNLQPDFVWVKRRESASDHVLQDSSRGFSSTTKLSSSSTQHENDTDSGGSYGITDPQWGYVSSASSDGFNAHVGTGTGDQVNRTSSTYVAWQWKAAGGTTTNQTGANIDSVTQANTTAGFSIVTYTGNDGVGQSVKHGLGTTPKMILFKRRDGAADWFVYHSALGNTKHLHLNKLDASSTTSDFANYGPDATSFYVNNTALCINNETYVAYCFAEKQGYSKFGKYVGNGVSNGTFVYTGFAPAFVMLKDTSQATNWEMFDVKRNPFNVRNLKLGANLSVGDNGSDLGTTSQNNIDILSNGFKMRTGNTDTNVSGDTYIYMAFAENPFVTSTGIPTTAR